MERQDLKLAQTSDLIDELASRSDGHLIALKLNGSEGAFVTKIGVDDCIATFGLHRIITHRLDELIINEYSNPINDDSEEENNEST